MRNWDNSSGHSSGAPNTVRRKTCSPRVQPITASNPAARSSSKLSISTRGNGTGRIGTTLLIRLTLGAAESSGNRLVRGCIAAAPRVATIPWDGVRRRLGAEWPRHAQINPGQEEDRGARSAAPNGQLSRPQAPVVSSPQHPALRASRLVERKPRYLTFWINPYISFRIPP